MFGKGGCNIAALWHHLEALLPRISDQRFNQLSRNPASAQFRRDQRVLGDPRLRG
jgi:hypothetical protein